MSTMTWPVSSSMTIGKAFAELAATTMEYCRRVETFNCWGGDGVKAYSRCDVDGSHVDEGIREPGGRLLKYQDVPDLKATMEVLLCVTGFPRRAWLGMANGQSL